MIKRALLVGVNINDNIYYEEQFKELKGLVKALDFKVEGTLEQNLKVPNKKYFIGPGKVEELKAILSISPVDVVVFNDELTPLQNKNLEDELNIEVIDRTLVILNIFANRARTKEAKLQVEVARLNYLLPRLVVTNKNYEQQAGGGVHNRGKGEKQIDIDRKNLRKKISQLENELDILQKNRDNQRKKRDKNNIPLVCLAGYTNAGKSTLLNAFLEEYNAKDDKKVFTKDMLFATLDPQIRRLKFKDNKEILLSDTVGFISKLPTDLIRAFRSTLEEILHADLIIIVADVSNSLFVEQIDSTLKTLENIGVSEDIPLIYVYNKADKLGLATVRTDDNRLFISAKNRLNLYLLEREIKEILFGDWISCKMFIPFENAYVYSYLKDHASVYNTKQNDNGLEIELSLSPDDFVKLNEFVEIDSQDA